MKPKTFFTGLAATALVGGLLSSTTPAPATISQQQQGTSVKFGSPGATINSNPCLLGPYVFLNGDRPNIPDCSADRIREAAKKLGD